MPSDAARPGAGADLDPRIARGMRAQLELRRARLAAGERPLGWKVGLGSAAAMERLGTDRPLVGFLTDRGLLPDGARVSVGDWRAPALEPEIAVRIGADGRSIAAMAAAIELADVHPPPADPEAILAGNVFHRHVVLGPFHDRTDAAGVAARVVLDGHEVAATGDPQALTGALPAVVAATAELLEACGERLSAGDVLITGSAVAPVPVGVGQRAVAELTPLGALSVDLDP